MKADPQKVGDALRRAGVTQSSSFVYVMRSGGSAPIKIGRSADVGARLAALQTAQAEPLELLLVLAGGRDVERSLHHKFASHRIRGEWFRPHRELLEYVTKMDSISVFTTTPEPW